MVPKDNQIKDSNQDGVKDEKDLLLDRDRLELELREEKADTQRKMAWVAISSMIIVTVVLFSPLVGDGRVASLADLLGLFYVSMAGIVGAYFGFTTWISKD